MRYILLVFGPQRGWRSTWCPDRRLLRWLTESGELVGVRGLTPEQARVVQKQDGGDPSVRASCRAPGACLAGYWIVDCDSLERAVEIAARISASPRGAEGQLGFPVEVRRVMMPGGEEM